MHYATHSRLGKWLTPTCQAGPTVHGVARQVGDPMTLLKPALTVVSRKFLLKARLTHHTANTTHAWHANFRATTVISVNHTVKDKCIELRVSTSKAGGLGWSVLGGPARWDRVWRGKQGARLATHTSCVQALKAWQLRAYRD